MTDSDTAVAATPKTGRRRTVPMVIGVALLAAAALVLYLVIPDHSGGYRRWREGSVHGQWRTVFDGEGSVGADKGTLLLAPRPPSGPTDTHAGLVVTRDFYHDVSYRVRIRTAERFRSPAPSPWEVAWVVWSYTDPHHFYYLTLKANGWELGKRDPAYPGGQRFLATGRPAYPPGPWYDVSIKQRGATITASVNGRHLKTLTDGELPYATGAVGCYTEDARAEFRSITVRSG